MTGRSPIMLLSYDGRSTDCQRASKILLHAVAEPNLSTAHLHRGKKFAIGQHLVFLCRAADSYVVLHDVVKRGEIGVRKWPVNVVAVAARAFEIDIAQPITLSSPYQ